MAALFICSAMRGIAGVIAAACLISSDATKFSAPMSEDTATVTVLLSPGIRSKKLSEKGPSASGENNPANLVNLSAVSVSSTVPSLTSAATLTSASGYFSLFSLPNTSVRLLTSPPFSSKNSTRAAQALICRLHRATSAKGTKATSAPDSGSATKDTSFS